MAFAPRDSGDLMDPELRQARPCRPVQRRGVLPLLRGLLARSAPVLLAARADGRRSAGGLRNARWDPPGLDPRTIHGGGRRADGLYCGTGGWIGRVLVIR